MLVKLDCNQQDKWLKQLKTSLLYQNTHNQESRGKWEERGSRMGNRVDGGGNHGHRQQRRKSRWK